MLCVALAAAIGGTLCGCQALQYYVAIGAAAAGDREGATYLHAVANGRDPASAYDQVVNDPYRSPASFGNR